MMSILYADERITERAKLAGQHECLNARHIALEGQRLEVEHQLDVLYPILRNTAWCFRRLNAAFGALLFGLNDLPLDFPDIVEVFVELRHVLWPKTLCQSLDALRYAVKNAGV